MLPIYQAYLSPEFCNMSLHLLASCCKLQKLICFREIHEPLT
uniref:Uncharacterized protein MANES_11G093500 n=1 Tax=Rhizophora mucronata TaxID=61149 RepID=A0A2P2KQP9_RHIMU